MPYRCATSIYTSSIVCQRMRRRHKRRGGQPWVRAMDDWVGTCAGRRSRRSRGLLSCWGHGLSYPEGGSGGRCGRGSFPPSRTFWLFLSQVLDADGSCREVVRRFLAWLALEKGQMASPNTGAYCRARARLPLRDLEQLNPEIVRRIERMETAQQRWYGRRVKVLDGSSVSMPDTPSNQQSYPQPKGQEPGCGFPVMRIVAVFKA